MGVLPKWMAAAALLALALPAGAASETPSKSEPKKIGLVEKAGAHLVQIDVTVRGPRDAASCLRAGDIDVSVGGREIREFQLDSFCAEGPESLRRARPANYLFYFDQRHLTPAGRRRAIQAARDMVPRLIVDGSRGMVVSSTLKLRVFTNLTSAPGDILKALDNLENDPEQNDASAAREDQLVADLQTALERARAEQRRASPGRGGNFATSEGGGG